MTVHVLRSQAVCIAAMFVRVACECVAVSCLYVLQCAAVFCNVLQCSAKHCSVLEDVAVWSRDALAWLAEDALHRRCRMMPCIDYSLALCGPFCSAVCCCVMHDVVVCSDDCCSVV